ncbi:hypothetical protein EAY64_18510 [Aquitalea palustris]|uniref:Uncharacterized protein n=1 Tax=Aquitalea palustris TaxID=2480983 RepID=A0A454JDS9_9NEIS|nr:hypothetical protein EAY64_18510 [Aquitalea palustris]
MTDGGQMHQARNVRGHAVQCLDSIASSCRIRLRQHLHRMAALRPGILMVIISENDEISTIAVSGIKTPPLRGGKAKGKE